MNQLKASHFKKGHALTNHYLLEDIGKAGIPISWHLVYNHNLEKSRFRFGGRLINCVRH
jgi:hypothetical protein